MASELHRPFGELRCNPGSGVWILRFATGDGRKRMELTLAELTESEREDRRGLLGELVKSARKRNVLGNSVVQDALSAVAGESKPARLDAWTSAARAVITGAAPPVPVAPKVPTLRQFAEQWASGDLAKRYPQHVRKRSSAITGLRQLLAGAAGDTPIDRVTLDTVEAALAGLPPDLMASTAGSYASGLRTLLKYAVYPCKYLDVLPMPENVKPLQGRRRDITFMRPEEDARFLACRKVPLEWRIWIGFMCREGLRAYSEAAELRWRDLDLDTGTIRLRPHLEAEVRVWAMDPGVARALKAWRKLRDGANDDLVFVNELGRQFQGAMAHGTAKRFRNYLSIAGVNRESLHTANSRTLPMRIEDCRGTFVTLSLAAGKSERWVQDRTGHTNSQTLSRRFRNAKEASELKLGELSPLYSAIPELLEATYQEAAE